MSSSQVPLPEQYPSLVIPSQIDYTSKDFQSFVSSMLAYAKQAMPNWNTSSEGDFGVMMVELFAYMGDILSYYGDRVTQEAYLPTATQRLSLLNIAATLGYIPGTSVPSSGTVTFQTSIGGPAVTVPQGTQVTTTVTPDGQNAPPLYETIADLVVPSNGGTNTVQVTQGITETLQQIGTSDGTVNQSWPLAQLGVITNTITVWIESSDPSNPAEWFPIDFLIDANSTQQCFVVSVDQAGITSIVFGDGVNGLIPAVGLNIYASYRVGMGSGGNLPSGSVSQMVASIPGVDIALAADGFTPLTSAMAGGSDAESNESIRQNASLAYRTQFRAVSPQDYTDLAYNVPGVLLSNAVFGNVNSCTLYVLGSNYAAPGPLLVENILDYFEDKSSGGVSLSVGTPNVVLVDIGTVTYPVQLQVLDNYSQDAVANKVTAVLQALLSPPNVSFGQLLNLSDIVTAVMGVAGVAYVMVPVFTREDVTKADNTSIQFRASEVPMIGTITLSPSGGQ